MMRLMIMTVMTVVVRWCLILTECLLFASSFSNSNPLHAETYSILTPTPRGKSDCYSHVTHTEDNIIFQDASIAAQPGHGVAFWEHRDLRHACGWSCLLHLLQQLHFLYRCPSGEKPNPK